MALSLGLRRVVSPLENGEILIEGPHLGAESGESRLVDVDLSLQRLAIVPAPLRFVFDVKLILGPFDVGLLAGPEAAGLLLPSSAHEAGLVRIVSMRVFTLLAPSR